MSGHTRVPNDVLYALQAGDINRTQFLVLILMHSWADYQTGRVRSFSAARVLAALNLEITQASRRVMQRTLRVLKDAGWYRDDYRHGDKRPYNAWLSNYRAKNSTGRGDDYPDQLKNRRQNAEGVADGDAEETILNLCAIKPCSNRGGRGVADDDGEGVAGMSPKYQYTGKNESQHQPQRKSRSVASDAELQTTQLLSFIWQTAEFIRTRAWASRLLETYSLDEIKRAIIAWLYRQHSGTVPDARTLCVFFEDGLEAVLLGERARGKLGLPQPEWAEYLADLERQAQGEPMTAANKEGFENEIPN